MFLWFSISSWSNFLLLFFLGTLILWFLRKRKTDLSMPGPFSLPIIGNLHQLTPDLHKTLYKMSKKYGNIFQMHLGQQTIVVISGRTLINEVLQSAKFGMRPDSFFARYLGKSFVFSPIPLTEHKQYKTFALTALKMTEKSFSTSFSSWSSSVNNLTLDELFSYEATVFGEKLITLSQNYETQFESLENRISDYKDAVMQIAIKSSMKIMTQVILGKR